jgi:hypothetical protein
LEKEEGREKRAWEEKTISLLRPKAPIRHTLLVALLLSVSFYFYADDSFFAS